MIEQYARVRIVSFNAGTQDLPLPPGNLRRPRAGDVATVVEVYHQPVPGYELECCDSSGRTVWLLTFTQEDVELELIPSE